MHHSELVVLLRSQPWCLWIFPSKTLATLWVLGANHILYFHPKFRVSVIIILIGDRFSGERRTYANDSFAILSIVVGQGAWRVIYDPSNDSIYNPIHDQCTNYS